MRVAQIIDELRASGGAERLQLTLAEALEKEEAELTVLTLHENDPESEQALRARGVRVVPLPSRRFGSARRALRLVRFLRDHEIDVLHTHLVRSTILGGIAGSLTRIPVVTTLHNTRQSVRLSPLLRALETWVLRHLVERVIAVGWETASAQSERLRGVEIDVIPNAVSGCEPLGHAEREKVRRELGIAPESLLVISVGRLHPQKAFSDMLRAFAATAARCPNAELRIVGGGRLEHELQTELDALGLGGRVALLGLRRDVPRLLAASDVYFSSAIWEGLPVAILEAMAAGLPIVATRVGDVPHVVTPASGALVEASDVEGLARELCRVLEDPILRRQQSQAALEASELFSYGPWGNRLLDLYAELTPGATRPPSSASPELIDEDPRCA
jgi:glycosyltransferase involved in cell wall biosynthesis